MFEIKFGKKSIGIVGFLLCVFASGVFVPASSVAGEKSKIAVMPIRDKSGRLDSKTVKAAAKYLRSGITAAPGFIVIAENRQNSKLEEMIDQKKRESYKECYAEDCQIPLGRQLAADSILRSEITYFGSCILSVQRVDLAKEAAVAGAREEFECDMSGLRGAIDSALGKLTIGQSSEKRSSTKRADATPSADSKQILQFASKPSEASVLLDGKLICSNTPCAKAVSRGTHNIRMTKPNYQKRVETISVTEGRKIKWKLQPKPSPSQKSNDETSANEKTVAQNSVTNSLGPSGPTIKKSTQSSSKNIATQTFRLSLGGLYGFGRQTSVKKQISGSAEENFKRDISQRIGTDLQFDYLLLPWLNIGVRTSLGWFSLGDWSGTRSTIVNIGSVISIRQSWSSVDVYLDLGGGISFLEGIEGNQFQLNSTTSWHLLSSLGGKWQLTENFGWFAEFVWKYQNAPYSGIFSGQALNKYDVSFHDFGLSTGPTLEF